MEDKKTADSSPSNKEPEKPIRLRLEYMATRTSTECSWSDEEWLSGLCQRKNE